MSSSQLMSLPGVAATRSTSSTSERSNWYGKVRPVSSSVSMPILVESRLTPAAGSWPAGPPAVTSAIATSARAIVGILLKQRLDFGERLLLRLAWNVIRAGQRHLGHRGRLDRQGTEVFWLQAVDV